MSSDIVERLRNHSKRSVGCDCVRCEAAAEIINLRQWKLEATQVLARGNALADLGAAEIERLRGALASERAEMKRLAGSPSCPAGECLACGGEDELQETCAKSQRPCGHHCNHWSDGDACDWCDAPEAGPS